MEAWGERCKERRRQKETLVSSFLLLIGFSHWSKLFFSILLLSFLPAPFFPLRGVKDKTDGPNCVAGPCSQQWPFEANFPAHGAEKDRERRTQRDWGTRRRLGGTGEVFRHVNEGQSWSTDVKKCTGTVGLWTEIFPLHSNSWCHWTEESIQVWILKPTLNPCY